MAGLARRRRSGRTSGVTDRLAAKLGGGLYPLPPGPFVFTTFGATPWPVPRGPNIMVWFLGQAGGTEIGEWWTFVFPGLALVLAVFCFNLLGDGLRDMIDPRRRT